MKYNHLGRAGLRVSELSFGAWLTFGAELDLAAVKRLMRVAFDQGVNFFDNAEAYGGGEAERLMGAALRDFKRSDVVVSTKIFWGGKGPNDKGLSYKHMVEGVHAALERLALDHVDLLYCHRPDPETPIEETVRAIDHLMRSGACFYWGTSEWPASSIERAIAIARDLGVAAPTMEQPQYNLLSRHRVEVEYRELFDRERLGATTWSPLASGILTGKYERGWPAGTRLGRVDWLRAELTDERKLRVRELVALARELALTPAQLAIAWCLRNRDVSSVILGASNEGQLRENLAAAAAVDKLDAAVLRRLDASFPCDPEPERG